MLYYLGAFNTILSSAGVDPSVFVPTGFNSAPTTNPQNAFSGYEIAKKVFNEFTEQTIDKNGFYLRIDKINLFKRVIPNVDPRDQGLYVDSWNYGISHGEFTSTPDKIGLTYLFAHATSNKADALDQNAWFTYMDQVVVGDTVIIYYEGNKYTYIVSEILVVSPDATGYYTGASPVSMVRMQFCGPPTGSLNARTLVDALLVTTEPIN